MHLQQEVQLFGDTSKFCQFSNTWVGAQLMLEHVLVDYGYCFAHFLLIADGFTLAAAQLAVHPHLYAAFASAVVPLAFVHENHFLLYCEETVPLGEEVQAIDGRTAEALFFSLDRGIGFDQISQADWAVFDVESVAVD